MVKESKKEMCEISDEILKQLQEDVSAIKVALLGNEYNPAGGLLCRTTELERELAQLRKRYDKMMAYAAGAGAMMSVVFSFLAWVIEKII